MFKISIIGLGYVGLPLAVEFAKKYPVVGFDINQKRIDELNSANDCTLEVSSDELKNVLSTFKKTQNNSFLKVTANFEELKDSNIYIITVPTPIDGYKKPDLTPLIKASETIGKVLKKGDIVIYESTVYPGCTEDDCVPVLEKFSGLEFNHDFYCGYSPERINPGDKERTVSKILKITSGSTPEIAKKIDELYKSIIIAGTYMAESIKVAEAAKVIENAQRDINIAFVNELALLFDKMKIDTNAVLEAAGTKWNFLKFKPGLVGGHCIGVDPYYLTYKAESIGYHPQVIHAGRRINDNMGIFIANKVIKLMIQKGHKIEGSKVLVLGITFKENCPDIRNSRVIDVINELKEFGCNVDIYDPWADNAEVKHEYGLELMGKDTKLAELNYDSVVLAVAHDEFKALNPRGMAGDNGVVFDVKAIFDKSIVDGRI